MPDSPPTPPVVTASESTLQHPHLEEAQLHHQVSCRHHSQKGTDPTHYGPSQTEDGLLTLRQQADPGIPEVQAETQVKQLLRGTQRVLLPIDHKPQCGNVVEYDGRVFLHFLQGGV